MEQLTIWMAIGFLLATYSVIGNEKKAIQDFRKANELDPTVIPKKQAEKI